MNPLDPLETAGSLQATWQGTVVVSVLTVFHGNIMIVGVRRAGRGQTHSCRWRPCSLELDVVSLSLYCLNDYLTDTSSNKLQTSLRAF